MSLSVEVLYVELPSLRICTFKYFHRYHQLALLTPIYTPSSTHELPCVLSSIWLTLLIMVGFTKLWSEQQYTSVFFHVSAGMTEAAYLFVSVGHSYFCSCELRVLSLGSSYMGPLDFSPCDPAWPRAHRIASTSLGCTLHIQRFCPALRFYVWTYFSHTWTAVHTLSTLCCLLSHLDDKNVPCCSWYRSWGPTLG